MNETDRPYHSIANLFPLLQGDEFEQLKASIVENGLLDPITLLSDGTILDGRNRYHVTVGIRQGKERGSPTLDQ